MTCICNDETITQIHTCKHCQERWVGPMPGRLRNAYCPHHKYNFDKDPWPMLCETCQQDNFYLDAFTGKVEQARCTCNDAVTETRICEKCDREKKVIITCYMERAARCPQHRATVAICGPSGFVCDDCTQ